MIPLVFLQYQHRVGMHDIGFFADIQYADILQLIWLIIDTYIMYMYIFSPPNCRDHQVSSVVELTYGIIIVHILNVLANAGIKYKA